MTSVFFAGIAIALSAGRHSRVSASGVVWAQVNGVPGVSSVNAALLDPSGKLYVVVCGKSLAEGISTAREVLQIVQRLLADSPYLQVAIRIERNTIEVEGRESNVPVVDLNFSRNDIVATDFFLIPEADILALGKPEPFK
jgi:hypothetical protein